MLLKQFLVICVCIKNELRCLHLFKVLVIRFCMIDHKVLCAFRQFTGHSSRGTGIDGKRGDDCPLRQDCPVRDGTAVFQDAVFTDDTVVADVDI